MALRCAGPDVHTWCSAWALALGCVMYHVLHVLAGWRNGMHARMHYAACTLNSGELRSSHCTTHHAPPAHRCSW